MNVFFIEMTYDGTIGGSHTCMFNLVKNLDRNKYQSHVAFLQNNQYVEKFKNIGVKVCLFERKPHIGGNIFIRKACNWYKLISKHRKELKNYFLTKNINLVVINNNIMLGNDIISVCHKLNIPVIVYERGFLNYNREDIERSNKVYSSIAISYAVKENMERQKYCSNTRMIYDGLPINDNLVKLEPNICYGIKQNMGIPHDSVVIAIIGNIREWKGQEFFVKAFMSLGEKYSNMYGLVIGEHGPENKNYFNYIKSIAEATNVGRRLMFLGFRDDVPDLLNITDVFIHTSITPEPFGMVILEAMLSKVPVIATNFGGPVEILDNGNCGILVPPKDEIAIVNGVEKYLSDPMFRSEIVDKAYRRVIENFDERITVRLVEELFQEAVSRAAV